MKTNSTRKVTLARILAVALAICMMASVLPMSTLAVNDAVNDARNGVLQVNLLYTDDDNNQLIVSTGTGFLVNDKTLVTCDHCVSLTDQDLQTLSTNLNKSVAEIKNRLSCSVTVTRDITLPAKILTQSYAMDFAILRLDQSLQKKVPLKIRTEEVKQTETVYAIGFPALPALQQNYSTFTSDDATITSGVVNKVSSGINPYSGVSTDYIMTSCDLDHGNSGGPMVDENGYVIGVCQAIITSSTDGLSPEFYYAVNISQVVETMDQLGIVYEEGGKNVEPQPTVPEETEPEETEPEETEPEETEPEETKMPTVDIDKDKGDKSDEGEKGSDSTMLILIIAAAAIVVVVVVVVIVVAGGKKKTVAPANVPPVPPVANNHVPGGFTPVTPQTPPAYNQNNYTAPVAPAAGETTILSQGAGETTVLSHNVNGGVLIRKRNGESININAEQFVIGRERKDVNYCISDNSSISRTHVRLTVRNGITYLCDLNAANGTFVNGVKAMPRQEIALKNGDKITLADEDLEYKI